MPVSYAVLIDGGFLRHKLSTASKQVDAAGIAAFAAKVKDLPCLSGMRLLAERRQFEL